MNTKVIGQRLIELRGKRKEKRRPTMDLAELRDTLLPDLMSGKINL